MTVVAALLVKRRPFIKISKLGVKVNHGHLHWKNISSKNTGQVDNEAPQGNIVSPLVFCIMINVVFLIMENGLGISVFQAMGRFRKLMVKK